MATRSGPTVRAAAVVCVVAAFASGPLVAPPNARRGETVAAHQRGTGVAAAGATSTTQAGSPSACSDGAYSLSASKWNTEYRFYIKSSTTPSGVSSSAAISAIRAGVANIARGDNDCGIAADVPATAAYQGTTTASANINTLGTCGTRDSRNVVDFGTLPSNYLALTCYWTSGGSIIEADVRLNKANYGWVTGISGCSNKFMIEAVATHEFGHAFGLNHVSESTHGNLTMSPTIMACQNSESTLGLGDVRGLEAKY